MVITGGPREDPRSVRLQGQFFLLVLRAAIVSRIPTRVRALDWRLELLTKDQNPPFVRHLVSRSIEQCFELETHALDVVPAAVNPSELRQFELTNPLGSI